MAGDVFEAEGATYPRGFSIDTDWKWPLIPARDLVTLNYGRALKADTRSPGKVPVFGTNGQCGWHDTPLAKAPGLIIGRKGQGPLGVEWCDDDFWVIDTAYYVSTLTPDDDLKYLYHLVKGTSKNKLFPQCSADMKKPPKGGRRQQFALSSERFTALSKPPSRIHATTSAWLMR